MAILAGATLAGCAYGRGDLGRVATLAERDYAALSATALAWPAMVTKLTLEYDGTHFAGWARQPGLRTVQEELERALQTILGEPLTLTVAGRTDRGVHAWEQVASYRHEALNPQRLNALLPEDVAVLTAEPAAEDFDARGSAFSRTYCYRVNTRRTRNVFMRGTALWWPHALDRQALHECARVLEGTHDFTAFTPTQTDHVRFQRDVFKAQWREQDGLPAEQGGLPGQGGRLGEQGGLPGEQDGRLSEQGGLLEFWIEADTFMRHMNRVLVGTMLEVAAGRMTLEDFTRLLTGRPRSEAGPTAPAHGLALATVAYR